MNWPALISALLEFLGPAILEWLRSLLSRTVSDLGPVPENPAVAVYDVFAAARDRLTWLDRLRGRGRVLALAERVALKRADALAARAVGSGGPVLLSTADAESLAL